MSNKIKHFVWRACNEALPTKTNLHHRHVMDSDICDLCGELPTDTVHALWSCKDIACVWSSLEWFHQSVPVRPMNFRELLARFMPSQDEYKAKIFAIAGWCVWNRCNAIHFNQAVRPVDSICKEASNILQEFLHVREVKLSPSCPQVLQQWQPPNPNIYKVNFDAAVFQASNLVGVGVIVRDNQGDPIGALTMPIPINQSVAKLETLACQRAVQLALEIDLTRVVVEGDFVTVIEALNNGTGQFANYGNVLGDIRFQSACFQHVEFKYISRVYNSIADALAKKASSVVGLQVWLEDLPDDIAPLVVRDVH